MVNDVYGRWPMAEQTGQQVDAGEWEEWQQSTEGGEEATVANKGGGGKGEKGRRGHGGVTRAIRFKTPLHVRGGWRRQR